PEVGAGGRQRPVTPVMWRSPSSVRSTVAPSRSTASSMRSVSSAPRRGFRRMDRPRERAARRMARLVRLLEPGGVMAMAKGREREGGRWEGGAGGGGGWGGVWGRGGGRGGATGRGRGGACGGPGRIFRGGVRRAGSARWVATGTW